MNIAIILAGGSGSRIGYSVPKQFIEILGKPVMAYTLEIFQSHPAIDIIEIVCPTESQPIIQKIIDDYQITKAKWFAESGDTFQSSTINGIFSLKGKVSDDDIVLLHSASSPMVTPEIIEDSIRVCKEHGNAVAANEMILCTGIKDNEYSSSTSILRENLIGFNFPWTFRYSLVSSVYERAIETGDINTLEPHTSSVLLAYGYTLYFSKSSTSNIKITHKEDLDLFEGYLLLREKRTAESTISEDLND